MNFLNFFRFTTFRGNLRFFLVLVIIILNVFFLPSFASAVIYYRFGGKILKKDRKVCLIPAPPPIFVVPLPFVYYEIGPPRPAKLYYLYGVSKTYRRYKREETAWSLGTYIIGADDAFRKACRNPLPDADGVISKIGTSCKEGEQNCE